MSFLPFVRLFRLRALLSTSTAFTITAGVPQGSILDSCWVPYFLPPHSLLTTPPCKHLPNADVEELLKEHSLPRDLQRRRVGNKQQITT